LALALLAEGKILAPDDPEEDDTEVTAIGIFSETLEFACTVIS